MVVAFWINEWIQFVQKWAYYSLPEVFSVPKKELGLEWLCFSETIKIELSLVFRSSTSPSWHCLEEEHFPWTYLSFLSLLREEELRWSGLYKARWDLVIYTTDPLVPPLSPKAQKSAQGLVYKDSFLNQSASIALKNKATEILPSSVLSDWEMQRSWELERARLMQPSHSTGLVFSPPDIHRGLERWIDLSKITEL